MISAFPDDPEDGIPISVTLIIVVVLSVPVYQSPFSNILDIGSLGSENTI